ncbi:hypothetical protein KR093_010882, partial [Drosophila rubida]
TLNVNFTLNEQLNSLNGFFNIKVLNGKQFLNFTGVEFDCKFLGTLYNHYLINMVAINLRSFSNFPIGCPLKKNHLYYMKDFKILTNMVPSYIPELSFETYASVFHKKRLVIVIKTGGKLRRK